LWAIAAGLPHEGTTVACKRAARLMRVAEPGHSARRLLA
jgi:hypothetical protein